MQKLPAKWVESIFARFDIYYGSRFAKQYSMIPRDRLVDAWCEDLGVFFDKPQCIKFALNEAKKLQWPPAIGEFIKLCDVAPKPITQQPTPQPINSTDASYRLGIAAEAIATQTEKIDHLRWAKRTELTARAKEMIIECAEAGDSRFIHILKEHFSANRIKGSRVERIFAYREEYT